MEQCRFYRQTPVKVHFVPDKKGAPVLVSIQYRGKDYPVEKVLSDTTNRYEREYKYVIREMKVLVCGKVKTVYNCVEDMFWYTLKEIDGKEYYKAVKEAGRPNVIEVWHSYPDWLAGGKK